MASKLDSWASEGIFKHTPPYVPYALVTSHNVNVSKLVSQRGAVLASQFNKVSRVFWEHLLFDTMTSFSLFDGNTTVAPRWADVGAGQKCRDREKVGQVRKSCSAFDIIAPLY